ncbi:MAG TPA: sugar ABC transporter ATP-binding protein [Bryobacteraceae bacterium]|jgi:ribose transport system ATP-binding protein|nr:sugar ABC transporter ATP-binding protein [Bryobacteraceae bacterium]
MTELLRVERVSKHFDGTQALAEVSLSVLAGEVHALVGENGAGKSTLAKVIAGVVRPDSGEILLDGVSIHLRNPLDAQRHGIGIIFQELDLFPHLSIAENIVAGNIEAERGIFVQRDAMDRFCAPLLERVGLNCSPRRLVRDLSLAQMQLVAIARALGMNARIIIMDEPTSSLSDDAASTLFELIRALKQAGASIIYVSHKMDEIFRIADRISVLRDSRWISTRPAAASSVSEIIRDMVGRELQESTRPVASKDSPVVLQVRSLSTAKLHHVSFDLHQGETLGVAGLVGSGRSSLGAVLFGLHPILDGSMELRGLPFKPRSPSDALKQGVGLVPEDRKLEGLMRQMSVIENSTFTVLDRMQFFSFIRQDAERLETARVHARLRLKAASGTSAVSTLSGGNQQKVLLSRWLLADPDVLFLDDPARGIDIGAKQDIYEVLDQLSAAGKGIILVSSELPELLRCSDRILVLRDGQITGILSREEATEERIIALATS